MTFHILKIINIIFIYYILTIQYTYLFIFSKHMINSNFDILTDSKPAKFIKNKSNCTAENSVLIE